MATMPEMSRRPAPNPKRPDAATVRPPEMNTLSRRLSRATAVLLAAVALASCTDLAFGDPGGSGSFFGQSGFGQPGFGQPGFGYAPYGAADPYAPRLAPPPWGGPLLGGPAAQPYAPWPNAYRNDPWNGGRAVTFPEDDVKCDARRRTCYTWSSKRDRWRQDLHETETYFGRKAARRVTDGKPERRR